MTRPRTPASYEWLTEEGAAEHIGKSRRWLQQRRYDGTGPPYRLVGRSAVYRVDLLDAWVDHGGAEAAC